MGVPGVNLQGNRFGNLVVAEKVKIGCGQYKWKCVCDCGKEHLVNTYHLQHGDIKSCGCMHHKYGHGQTNTRLYHIWCTMKARCNRPTAQKYNRYGGRGIKLCDEWQTFENFHEWAINNGYAENLSIDRIDNDKGYYPENCRWATNIEQANNTSKTRRVNAFGETHTIREWSAITGVDFKLISRRLAKGWEPEPALTVPKYYYKGGAGRGHKDAVYGFNRPFG